MVGGEARRKNVATKGIIVDVTQYCRQIGLMRKEASLSPIVERAKDGGSSIMTMCDEHQAENS